MTAQTPITLDTTKLNDALARFPRDRAMWIGGREVDGGGETIERLSPAHGVVVTRVPRGVRKTLAPRSPPRAPPSTRARGRMRPRRIARVCS